LGEFLRRARSPAAMNLFCVGLSHHRTRVEEREQFAGHPETLDSLRQAGCAEALLLSTCNRVEVYAAAEALVPIPHVARCLACDFERTAERTPVFYCYEATDCVRHLFRVVAGIESMVVGETEILGQVKKAYELARASAAAGPYLHRLLQRAFRVAKQVRTRTHITRGSVSIGSVAVHLASKVFGDLAERQILIIGAGGTSKRTVRALISRGARNVRVSNRSPARAAELAELVGGVAVPFNEWLQHCEAVDILVTATASDAPLVNPKNLASILRERAKRPLFIIDIAVPRNVDPEVNQLEGVFLYDIDSLRSVAEQSMALRRQQIASAEAIISAHVSEFWTRLSGGASREESCPGAVERFASSGAGKLGLWSSAGRFVAEVARLRTRSVEDGKRKSFLEQAEATSL
jgi:glutamyl-tRNA reductase